MIFRNPLSSIVLFAGAAGFLLGAAAYPTWQHAVEGAQVVAGIVDHRLPSPFIMYQVNLWTISHQILAVFLKLGLSEQLLSWFVSGGLGCISFIALGALAYAFSKNTLFSFAFPFWVHYTDCVNFGTSYTILLMRSVTTYSILGLSFAIASWAFLSLGRAKIGSFMIALAPAVHPSMGGYAFLIAGLVFIFNIQNKDLRNRIHFPFLLMGLTITLASFLHNRFLASEVLQASSDLSAPLVASFAKHWCDHRFPAPWNSQGFLIHLSSTLFSFLALRSGFQKHRPLESEMLLRMILVSGILGAIFYSASHLPPEQTPGWLLSLIPARFIKLNIFLYPAMVLGLILQKNSSTPVKIWGLICIAIIAKLANHIQIHPEWMAYFLIFMPWPFLILVIKDFTLPHSFHILIEKISIGLFVFMIAKTIWLTPERSIPFRADFFSKEDKPFWHAVSKHPGMLLTSHDHYLVQLHTRRAVLLEVFAIDGVPYAPSSAPLMNNILKDLYKTSLERPNPSGDEIFIEEDKISAFWSEIKYDEWKFFAKKYSFSQVLTRNNTALQLPIAEKNDRYTLYNL